MAAYRAAVEEIARDRVPVSSAVDADQPRRCAGVAWERAGGTVRLEEAVTRYRAALKERTRERVPLQWALTQNDVGNALLALRERETGTARLEEAVAAYRAALEETAGERVSVDWALTQNNLGIALEALGEREKGTEAARGGGCSLPGRALKWKKERASGSRWIGRKRSTISALRFGGWASGRAGRGRLEEAVAAFRAALEEITRERAPLQWALTLRTTSAMRSTRWASGRSGPPGWRRRSRPFAPHFKKGRASEFRSSGRRRRTISAMH